MRSLVAKLRSRAFAFLATPAGPNSLAILRVVTFANVLAFFPHGKDMEAYARLPAEFRAPPPGLGWLVPNLPITGPLIRWCSRAMVVAATMAMIGFFTTGAAVTVVVLGLYLGGMRWYYVHHGHDQHLIWFAAILAASPCADALSVDELMRRRGRGRIDWLPSPAYGLSMRSAWLLLGSIYFVPGVGKLASGGAAWVFSDNLRNRIWLQWDANATRPSRPIRNVVDHAPRLVRLAACGSVAFELGFVFATFTRRGRMAAGAASVIFHVSVWLVMQLQFLSLATVHVGLADWSHLGRRLRSCHPRARSEAAAVRPATKAPGLVAAVIIMANYAMPLTGHAYGWPFSIYPVFRGIATSTRTVLAVELHRAGRPPEPLDLNHTFRSRGIPQYVAGFLNSMMLEALAADQRERFRALWQYAGDDMPLGDQDEVVFYADLISVDPSRAADPVLRRDVVYRLRGEQ